jgi:hypothetical protein
MMEISPEDKHNEQPLWPEKKIKSNKKKKILLLNRSQSYQTFFLCKMNIFLFFATKLGWFTLTELFSYVTK